LKILNIIKVHGLCFNGELLSSILHRFFFPF